MASKSAAAKTTILVLGAYGLIGSNLAASLSAAGYRITGLGRSAVAMNRGLGLTWVSADLHTLQTPEAWVPLLKDHAVVVNAAGSLQDGPKDQLEAVHFSAMKALAHAAALHGIKVIQISAAGASQTASTAFMRTKAAGDAALLASGADATVLRPGLVMARSVYGGTALLRMLSAVPLVQPIAMPKALIQVTDIEDLCNAVLWAVANPGQIESYDILCADPVELGTLTAQIRGWLGFRPARFTFALPSTLTGVISALADGLALLGWRSPLRTTALRVLADGVTGNPAPWQRLSGQQARPLSMILAQHPATIQDRWHARLALVFPVLIVGLSLFWLASGVIGLLQLNEATAVLTDTGISSFFALAAVVIGSVLDIALGALILLKRWARAACFGMIALSLGYLGAGTIWTPWLWADPLGPFVKVLPTILAAATAWCLLDDR